MNISKEQFMEEFNHFLREEYLEKALKYRDEQLFSKLTGDDWKNHLYVTGDSCEKNFVLDSEYSLNLDIEFAKFSKEGTTYHYVKKQPRQYEVSDSLHSSKTSVQNLHEILCSIDAFCDFTEKQILINELLKVKDLLSSNLLALITYINSNEELIELCNFVSDKKDLNGAFYALNNTIYLKEHQTDVSNHQNYTEILDYYNTESIEFFIVLNENSLNLSYLTTIY